MLTCNGTIMYLSTLSTLTVAPITSTIRGVPSRLFPMKGHNLLASKDNQRVDTGGTSRRKVASQQCDHGEKKGYCCECERVPNTGPEQQAFDQPSRGQRSDKPQDQSNEYQTHSLTHDQHQNIRGGRS